MNTETTNNGPAVTGVSVIEYLSNISTVLTGITTNINEQVTRLIAAQSTATANLNKEIQNEDREVATASN
jgi:hypothetical protein